MRLTVYTDYSLRVLIYIAARPDPLPTIPMIAASYGVSRNHLVKVVHQLGLMGYLTTVRGKGGGLRLARAAKSIVVGDVVRRTEPDLALVPCFEPINADCAITPACKLRKTLFEAREAFLKVLDNYTLADLTANASALSSLLAANGPATGMQVLQPKLQRDSQRIAKRPRGTGVAR